MTHASYRKMGNLGQEHLFIAVPEALCFGRRLEGLTAVLSLGESGA